VILIMRLSLNCTSVEKQVVDVITKVCRDPCLVRVRMNIVPSPFYALEYLLLHAQSPTCSQFKGNLDQEMMRETEA